MHKLDQTTTSHSLDTNSPALLKAGDDTAQTSDPTLGVGCEGDSSVNSKDEIFDSAKLEHLCANKANHAFTIALPILTTLLNAKNLNNSKDTLSEGLDINDSREEICIATILATLNKAQGNFADKFLELSSSIQELIYPKLAYDKQKQVLSLAYNNDFLLSLQLSHGLLEPLLAKKLCFISINGDKEHTQALIAIPRQIASTNQELENQDLSKPKALLIEQRADGNEFNEFANEYWELYYFENFCSEDLITLDSSYLLVGDNLVSHGALFKHHQILDLSQLELILEPKFLVDSRFYGPFAASLQSLAKNISTYVPKEWSQVATCLTSAPQFSSSYLNSLAQNTDSLPIRLAVALLYICVVNDEAYSPNIDDEQLKSFHQLAFNSIKAQLPDALKAILQDYSSLSKRLAVNASVINKLWASNEEITNKYYPAIEHLVAKLGIGDSNENNSSLEKLIALLQPRIERSLIIMDDDLVIPLCRYFELTHIQYPQSNDLSSFIAPTIDVKKIVQKTSGNDLLDYLLASYAFVYKTSLLWVFDSELGSLLHNDCVQSLFFAPKSKLKNFVSLSSSKKLIAFDSTTRTASSEHALPDNSSNTETHAQEAPENKETGVSDDTEAVVSASAQNSIIVGSLNSIDHCAQLLLNLPNNPLFALTDELILVGYSASMLKYCYQLKSLGNAIKFSNILKHFRQDYSELAHLSQYQFCFSIKQSNEFLEYCKSQDLQLNYPANNNTKLIYHRHGLESFDFSYIKSNDDLKKIVQGYEYITEVAEFVSPLNFSLNFVRSTSGYYGNWELSSFIKEDVNERYLYGYDNLAYYYASQLRLLKELLAQNFVAQAYTQVFYIVPLEQDVAKVSAIIKELKDFNENKIAISVLSLRALVTNKNYASLWFNTHNLIVVDNLLSNYATELLRVFKDQLVALKSHLESQVAQENQFLAVSELSKILNLSCLPLTVTTNNSTSASSDNIWLLSLYQMGHNYLSLEYLQDKGTYVGFDAMEFYRDPSAILNCMITGLMCLLQKHLNNIRPSSIVALYYLDPKFTFDLENTDDISSIDYSKIIFKDLGLVSHFKYIDLPLFKSDDELNSYRSLVGKFFNKDEYNRYINKLIIKELEDKLFKKDEETPTQEPEVEVEVEVEAEPSSVPVPKPVPVPVPKLDSDSNIFVNSPELVLKYLAFDKDSPEYQQALDFALGEMSKKLIGGNEWRDYQKEALPYILSRDKDCIISIPTGGGKSVLFQGPALFRAIYSKKLSIVISPLKALIIDQVMTIKDKGFGNVDYLSSDRLFQENNACIEKIKSGQINLLYVTPERFRTRSFYLLLNERLKRDHGAEYFIFDEAHCISQWGKTFRPDYIFAAECCSSLKEQYGGSFIMCSATMTKQVIKDIEQYLDNPVFLDNNANKYNPIPEHIVMSVQCLEQDNKIDAIRSFIVSNEIDFNKSRMIIFCPTRKICEKLSNDLNEIANSLKLSNPQSPIAAIADHVSYFHAGLSAEQRKYRFERFKSCSNLPNDQDQTVAVDAEQTICDFEHYELNRDLKALKDTAELSLEEEDEEEGDGDIFSIEEESSNKREIFILCSTNAFGMGMDIPNIHYVLHHTPSNLFEDYLQEVGRAGRSYQSYQDTFTNNRKLPALCLYEKPDLEEHLAKMNSNMISWSALVSAEKSIRAYIAEFESFTDATQAPCIVPVDVVDRFTYDIHTPIIQSTKANTQSRLKFYYLEHFKRINMRFRNQPPLLLSINKEKLEQYVANALGTTNSEASTPNKGESTKRHNAKGNAYRSQVSVDLAQLFITGLNFYEPQENGSKDNIPQKPDIILPAVEDSLAELFPDTSSASDATQNTEISIDQVFSSPNNAPEDKYSQEQKVPFLSKVKHDHELEKNYFSFSIKAYCSFKKLNYKTVYNSLIELNSHKALSLKSPLLISLHDSTSSETKWFSKYLENHKSVYITDHQITLMLPTLGTTLAVVRELLDDAYQHYVHTTQEGSEDAATEVKSDDLAVDQAYLEKERNKAQQRNKLKKQLGKAHGSFKRDKSNLSNTGEYYFTKAHLLSLIKNNLGSIRHLCPKLTINGKTVLYMPWEDSKDNPSWQNKASYYLRRLQNNCIRTFLVICSYLPKFELRSGSDNSVNIESGSSFILFAPDQSYHLLLDVLAQDAVKLLTMLSETPNKALNQLYSGPDKVVTSSNIHSYDWMDLINNFGLVHDDPKTLLGKYDLSCSRSDFDQLYPLCQSSFDGYGYFSFLLDVLSNLKLTYNSNIINYGYEVTIHKDASEPLDAAIQEDSPFYPLRKELEMVDKTSHARALIMKVFISCLEDSQRAEFIERFFKIEDYRGYVDLLTLYSQGKEDSILSELTSEELTKQEDKFKDNAEQRAIYEEPLSEHHINVIAGPGSGKTFILTMKVARLVIREHVSPRNILVLAYNRAVVTELKSRLNNLFTGLGLGGLAHRLNIFTFHGLAKYCLKNALNDISTNQWEYKLLESLKTNHLEYFKNFRNLEYILIDEFQDITFTRLNFLLLLHQLNPKVHFFTIGDMNQSIYGFSRVSNEVDQDFIAFAKQLAEGHNNTSGRYYVKPEARYYAQLLNPEPYYEYLNKLLQPKTMHLRQNYRSYQGILDKSAKFIDNTQLLPVSNAALQQYAVAPCAWELQAKNLYDHMHRFFKKARESFAAANHEKTSNPETQDEKVLRNEVNTIAFLYRTNNDVYKGFSALNRNLLKDFDIYIQGSSSCESFRKREFFALKLFIESQPQRISIDPQKKDYFGNKVKQFCLAQMDRFTNWDRQLLDIGYCLVLNFIDERRSQSNSASVDINELKEYYNELLQSDDTTQLMKIYDLHKDQHLIPSKPLKLILSTMHKVKGLEFDMVVVMPSNISLPTRNHNTGYQEIDQANNMADLQEEKRLYYVAYTRAKKYLLAYKGPREEALINNRCYPAPNNPSQRFVDNEPKLDHYNIGYTAVGSNFSINQYIANYVAINDPANIQYDSRVNRYLIKHAANNRTIGCLAKENPIAKNMQEQKVTRLTGFFVSDIVAWTYQDTCKSDEKYNSEHPGKKREYAKNWAQVAIDQGYIYVILIAGYGQPDPPLPQQPPQQQMQPQQMQQQPQ